MNTKYKSKKDMKNKLQSLNIRTKSKINPDFINFYDEFIYRGHSNTFQFKNSRVIAMIMQEAMIMTMFLVKFSKTKPQIKNKNIYYFDL